MAADVNIGKVIAAIWLKFDSVVGVGDEAHRRIEGEQRVNVSEMQRVERQMILEHKYEVDDHRHREIRHEHLDRIGLPGHRLATGPLPNEEVDEVVDGIQYRI